MDRNVPFCAVVFAVSVILPLHFIHLSSNHSGARLGACSEGPRGRVRTAAGEAERQTEVLRGGISAGHGALPVHQLPADRREER